MAEAAFDTLDAARGLKAAGIEGEHAEAIVEVMGQSVNHLVTRKHFDLTVEHFNMAVERLDAAVKRIDAAVEHLDAAVKRIDSEIAKLSARIDSGLESLRTELSARTEAGLENLRTELVARMDVVEVKLQSRIDAIEKNMWKALVLSVGVVLAAITLATTILGMMLARGGGM